MGGGRGKFSFPIPGRKAQRRMEKEDDYVGSIPSIPPANEWLLRHEESSSKAHRVLGTSDPIYRTASKQSSISAGQGYMSITVSEASFGSHNDDTAAGVATTYREHQALPTMSRKPSSSILGHAHSSNGRRGSDHSTTTRRLHLQTSNSTMRSHYDAKSSPLAVSQQTSDSAVRDMALRRGKPQVVTDLDHRGHVASPISPVVLDQTRKREQRKSKPARLDLSKLFPKPRAADAQGYSTALLSPTKMVNSPMPMSTPSENQFPRPMTREPTPNPRGQVKLKSTPRQQVPVPPVPSSPMRKFERDPYDNAKLHVRRPPKGVQHWFDALDDDSDEAPAADSAPLYAPQTIRPTIIPKVPIRKASLGRLPKSNVDPKLYRTQHLAPAARNDTFSHEDLIDDGRVASPSLVSLHSNTTKASAVSKSNLQNSSVLSLSSSEDECEETRPKDRRISVRKSLDMNDDAGVIIIGQAQALEVHPRRRPSAAQMSTRSVSTNAATIEVMYTPEPPLSPFNLSKLGHHSNSRRSSHVRQPSVIMEDDDLRPKTAFHVPMSPKAYSVRSARTSASEPLRGTNGSRKLMAVTAEEEALLELMRKKRAAMAKNETAQVDLAAEEDDKAVDTKLKNPRKKYRTSGFLAEASPVRMVETRASRKASATPSPLLPPARGRSRNAHYDSQSGQSVHRDRSASDAWSEHHNSPVGRANMQLLPTPCEFLPLDPFIPSSPVLTASITSPTTTDHASPLPSPITPGLRAYEQDFNVKVASSDTSNEHDDLNVMQTKVVGTPAEGGKSPDPSHEMAAHRRRRTASSSTDVSFPAPPTNGLRDLTPVTEVSSRPNSGMEPVIQLVHSNSKGTNGWTSVADTQSRGRQNSIRSINSRTSVQSCSPGNIYTSDKRNSRRIHRQSNASILGTSKGKRSSVSDDVLAAWSSLGGTY